MMRGGERSEQFEAKEGNNELSRSAVERSDTA
jgi:hypothetical protein